MNNDKSSFCCLTCLYRFEDIENPETHCFRCDWTFNKWKKDADRYEALVEYLRKENQK